MDLAPSWNQETPGLRLETVPEPRIAFARTRLIQGMKGGTMAHHLNSGRGSRTGATLVELVYATIGLGVLAGLTAPLIEISSVRMNSAVADVADDLRSAQRQSKLRGHEVVVAFDEENHRLRVHLDSNNDGKIQDGEAVQFSELGGGVTFGRTEAPALNPSTQRVTFSRKQHGIKGVTFHPNGTASEKGFVYLTNGKKSQARSNRAIEVSRTPSEVKSWSYGTGEWQETG
jgi:Tfp pilus assembly protein FimT